MRSTPKIEPDRAVFFPLQEGVTYTTVKLSKRSSLHAILSPSLSLRWTIPAEGKRKSLRRVLCFLGALHEVLGFNRCSAGVWVDLPKPVWSCSPEPLSKTWKKYDTTTRWNWFYLFFPKRVYCYCCRLWGVRIVLFEKMQNCTSFQCRFSVKYCKNGVCVCVCLNNVIGDKFTSSQNFSVNSF